MAASNNAAHEISDERDTHGVAARPQPGTADVFVLEPALQKIIGDELRQNAGEPLSYADAQARPCCGQVGGPACG